jgi:hypothetical protein
MIDHPPIRRPTGRRSFCQLPSALQLSLLEVLLQLIQVDSEWASDQGADTPVPVPAGVRVPVPDLPGGGDAPPSPPPICPELGTLPRPRPRFAEIGPRARGPLAGCSAI